MVDTAQTAKGFCHLFLDGKDQYLFVKNLLGDGRTSLAQVVLHLQTGELRVRKVSREHLDEEEKRIEDREKILFYLQEQAAKLGVQPYIAHLFSANDVPAAQGADNGEWSRVSYMRYYDGGNVEQLCDFYGEMEQEMPSSMILRLLKQVGNALNFMSKCGVLHGDLHGGNIFIHRNRALGGLLDFYIGDFGDADHVALRKPKENSEYTMDVYLLVRHLEIWLSTGQSMIPQKERDMLWLYLEGVVLHALFHIANKPTNQLPDLEPVLELLESAPEGPPETLPFGYYDPEDGDACEPLYRATETDAFSASPGVDGPWHLAQVSIDRSTGRPTVVSFTPETYHTGGLVVESEEEDFSEESFSS